MLPGQLLNVNATIILVRTLDFPIPSAAAFDSLGLSKASRAILLETIKMLPNHDHFFLDV